MTFSGSPIQVGLAEWLLSELDRPADSQGLQNGTSAKQEYIVSTSADDRVRVFHVKHAQTVSSFQEIATDISATTRARVFTYNAARAVVVRGSEAQLDFSDFLLDHLDKPEVVSSGQGRVTTSPDYRLPGSSDLARVFYLPSTRTILSFQELSTLVRAIADIRFQFTYNAPRAIVIRGTEQQLGLAEWLFTELSDSAADRGAATVDYGVAGSDNVTRVFYLKRIDDLKILESVASKTKFASGSNRVFVYSVASALVIRGTSSQIAIADRVIHGQDQ